MSMCGSSEFASDKRCDCNDVGDVKVNADEGGGGVDCDCASGCDCCCDDEDWRVEIMAA